MSFPCDSIICRFFLATCPSRANWLNSLKCCSPIRHASFRCTCTMIHFSDFLIHLIRDDARVHSAHHPPTTVYFPAPSFSAFTPLLGKRKSSHRQPRLATFIADMTNNRSKTLSPQRKQIQKRNCGSSAAISDISNTFPLLTICDDTVGISINSDLGPARKTQNRNVAAREIPHTPGVSPSTPPATLRQKAATRKYSSTPLLEDELPPLLLIPASIKGEVPLGEWSLLEQERMNAAYNQS